MDRRGGGLPVTVLRVAGVDEVGRGSLFGVVAAAAVVLDRDGVRRLTHLGVTDSKALSAQRREQLAADITAIALDVRIGTASVAEIDQFNILQATFLAMRRAIAALDPPPDLCSVDGNRAIPQLGIPQRTVIQGDRRDLAIGAASIVAKVWRDREIAAIATRYPGYDLAQNKGYGTASHRAALQQLGVTPDHRLSFSPCRQAAAQSQLSLLTLEENRLDNR
jgi:ribonuclease HII